LPSPTSSQSIPPHVVDDGAAKKRVDACQSTIETRDGEHMDGTRDGEVG
jgi:hypothetical protein